MSMDKEATLCKKFNRASKHFAALMTREALGTEFKAEDLSHLPQEDKDQILEAHDEISNRRRAIIEITCALAITSVGALATSPWSNWAYTHIGTIAALFIPAKRLADALFVRPYERDFTLQLVEKLNNLSTEAADPVAEDQDGHRTAQLRTGTASSPAPRPEPCYSDDPLEFRPDTWDFC